MKKLDVLTFGEVLWDLFEDPKMPGTFVQKIGGAPTNVAIHCARLGLKSGVLGAVGDDFLGADLRVAIEREGVDGRVLLTKKRRTGVVFVRRDSRGEPQFLFYREAGADLAVTAADVRALKPQARWVHLSTSTLSRPALAKATKAMLQIGGELVVDLNVRPRLFPTRAAIKRAAEALLPHAKLVKASLQDVERLGFSDERKAIEWLRRSAPEGMILFTRGGDPVEVVAPNGARVRIPTPKSRVVDATGAGDAFLSGVLAMVVPSGRNPKAPSFYDPQEWVLPVQFGQLIASKVVSMVGATTGTEKAAQLWTRRYKTWS